MENKITLEEGKASALETRYATRFQRLQTREAKLGKLGVGADNPIRLQSMTTSSTANIEAVVQETLRIVEAGAEIVRITTQNIGAVQSLAKIKSRLRQLGCEVPLVADVHFTPNAALLAAEIVEKVRINPGNFVDKKRFVKTSYDEASYKKELEVVEEKFSPLLAVCRQYSTALRIGVNHGSLSDRIVNRYGDSPLGMVESAYEFLVIAQKYDFHNIIFSMKSSNPIVMVQAYRMLAMRMIAREALPYPMHLGVTEAGDDEQGRVKSATGIASLLVDGIGDTIRVSLTEPAEKELPVAAEIVSQMQKLVASDEVLFPILQAESDQKSGENNRLEMFPLAYRKRYSAPTASFGGNKTPKVYGWLAAGTPTVELWTALGHRWQADTEKWHSGDLSVDGVFIADEFAKKWQSNEKNSFLEIPSTVKVASNEKQAIKNIHKRMILLDGLETLLSKSFFEAANNKQSLRKEWLLRLTYEEVAALTASEKLVEIVRNLEGEISLLLVFSSEKDRSMEMHKTNALHRVRSAVYRLHYAKLRVPVLLQFSALQRQGKMPLSTTQADQTKKANAINMPGTVESGKYDEQRLVELVCATAPLFLDGLLDGVFLPVDTADLAGVSQDIHTTFLMLQAVRQRIAKPEYISCPSCGRTLFDLQEVTAKIKARTSHLKGVKIGIMGCIVNGPGEMADADFGYVGAGRGLITLYKGQNVVKRNIAEAQAVDALVELIKENNMWVDPF